MRVVLGYNYEEVPMAKKNSKKKKKEINKGERERLRLKKQAELEAELAELEQEDEGFEFEEENELTALDKEYFPGPVEVSSVSYERPLPTSFEELDAQRDAQEKASQVRRVTYDVQDLVWNILHDPESEAPEKASKMTAVAQGFSGRVDKVMADPDDMQKDMDVLQIEAMLGTHDRAVTLVEKGINWAQDHIMKGELSTQARKKMQDDDFALPDVRKYPIHDKAHVRNALARAAQMIKKGGKAAEEAKKALPKIKAAAKKFGIDSAMEKSAILIQKDLNGDWRWVGRPSNNFIDLQEDIISKSAHKKYVSFLTNNPDMAPQFMTWHQPGTSRVEKADGWLEHEGALIMSGKLTEDEAAHLLKAQAHVDIGMSVAGVAQRGNPKDPREVTEYYLYEVSDLPRHRAANPFTSLETMITKEVSMNDQEKIKYLSMYMGSEENAKAFLEKTGQSQKQLQEAGLTSKESQETETSEPAAEEPLAKTTPEPVAAKALDVEEITKQILARVGEEFEIDGLNEAMAKALGSVEKVALLEEVVKELSGSRDDELAEKLTPPAARFAWSVDNKPSSSDKNILSKDNEEDEKLIKAAPSAENWLSNLTQTVPVEE